MGCGLDPPVRVDAGGVWGVVWIHQAGKRVDAGGVWGVVWIH